MGTSVATDLVTAGASRRGAGAIPIAQMRSVYRCDDVERRLNKLPAKEHESLRCTYERMLEKGPERFQVKPSGLPAMDHLYDELPNFHAVLDDVKRQLALCQDSRDALEITPMLLLGPPGIGKTHFARELAAAAGHRHGLRLDELADRRLGAVGRVVASGRARAPARSSRRWSTARTPTR